MGLADFTYVDSSECAGRDSMCFYPGLNVFVSYPFLIGGHLSYLAIVLGLKRFMKNRPAMDTTKPMLVYNAVQVVLSLLMAIYLSPFLLNNLFNINGKFTARIELWIFVHYMIKYLDMFDTYFMVLRKKEEQLSFLHIYHHLTIGMIWGLLLHHGVANGTAFFGAWINSCIHALMYFHYLYTSLGYVNPLKKYLTQLQMIQFGLCILQAVLALLLDRQIPTMWAVLQLTYHMSLLYLFMQFYKRVIRKGRKGAKADKAANGANGASKKD